IFIVIPVNAQFGYTELKRLIQEFPFSIPIVFRQLKHFHKQKKFRGAAHKWQIQPEWINKYIHIIDVRKSLNNCWLYGRKGKIIKKLLKGKSLGGHEYIIHGRI
ncbi:MAG: hypothetical protein ACTSX6_10405, partial [Candidatus Heimdallarchaeaceae archaeon]